MHGVGDSSGRDEALGEESHDEAFAIEPLEPETDSSARDGRLRTWLAERALAWPERRLTPGARARRTGVVVALVVTALFALLGGPTLVSAGWAQFTSALRGAPANQTLAMTRWRVMEGPPALPGANVTYTPDPLNPARVYACAAGASGIVVSRTDSGGNVWQNELAEPASMNSSCQVKVALDDPEVTLVVIYTFDPRTPGCERLSLYRSSDDEVSWQATSTPVYPDACLGDVWPSAHTLYYWWTNVQGGQALTGLSRTDDLGATWYRVPIFPFQSHFSLAPALLDSGSGDSLITQVYMWPGPGQRSAMNEVWRSLDGGFSWRRAVNAPLGAVLFSSTEPGALRDVRWPPTYAAVFSGGELSPPWVPNYAPASIQALQPDGSTWRTVPPLPLPQGNPPQSPTPLGISAALAVGSGGDLLALGQKPGTIATLNSQREEWLWAWDPAIQKWRVGARAPGAAELTGLTWARGPAGGLYAKADGAYLWLTGDNNGQRALYWTFIPTKQ